MSYRSGALLTAVAFAWLAPQAPAEEINKHFYSISVESRRKTLSLS